MAAFQDRPVAEDSRVVLAELRRAVGAENDDELVRRALSLVRIASRYADEDGEVTIRGKAGEAVIKLRG